MTRVEHLLAILAEECVEIAQRATKALRFGLSERQPSTPSLPTGSSANAAERLILEYADLVATFELLTETPEWLNVMCYAAYDEIVRSDRFRALVSAKKVKIEKYLAYAREIGTLQ